ncbi:nuclear transport factor 2 family protein [Antrihabitans cavernicola]|uniref:Ketosteroid isomerase n=1 Tax=Antrihabitans cavernicola TaxID=2495913 RepID=A0A5A7SAQ2_9NOCA|nr:nuclear transport factor 2 family protein [Spelaeibacter cavernicola]KAA0023230.1 ketosteroid isomerase [Spelaeibacter cavernicola]
MPTPTPSAVFEALIHGIATGRRDRLHELYAENAEVRHAFGMVGTTAWHGSDEIREHFASPAAAALQFDVANLVIHRTDDPEVVIGEFDYHALIVATGKRFEVANIVVMRVRDGKIVESRDYHNHLALAHAVGRLPEVVAALG